MKRLSENQLSTHNIAPPLDMTFVMFDSAQQAIISTLEQLEGKIEGNTFAQIKTELLISLKETYSVAERGQFKQTTAKNYSFESSLSNLIMKENRNLSDNVRQMLKEVNQEFISGQESINPKAILKALEKGYEKVFREFRTELAEKVKAIPAIANVQGLDSINALFKKTLIESVSDAFNNFSKTLKGDKIFHRTHPVNDLYNQAIAMFREKKSVNPTLSATNFVTDNYYELVGKAVGKYLEQQTSEFLDKEKKPMSYTECKDQLNDFFKPHIQEALSMNDNDPEKPIRINLIMEAKKAASQVIEIHYQKHHDMEAPRIPNSKKSAMSLDSIGSEPSSRRGSLSLKSLSSSRRGSMKVDSSTSKGIIPDAFRIDPDKLKIIKAEQDAQQQTQAQDNSFSKK